VPEVTKGKKSTILRKEKEEEEAEGEAEAEAEAEEDLPTTSFKTKANMYKI
jgi:hypothetical protein